MKRHLSPEEIKICRDSLKRLAEELEDLKLSIEENILILAEGLDIALQEQTEKNNLILKNHKPTDYNYKLSKLRIKILKHNYPRQKEKYKELIKEMNNRSELNHAQIKILNDQIRNGVTVIEKTAPVGT